MNAERGAGAADPGLLILTSLASGEKHGYAIMEDVEALAGVRLGPGTLYGALSRLEKRGLIAALPVEGAESGGTVPPRRRRPYRLTEQGQELLVTELRRLSRLAEAGLRRLEPGTAAG